VLLKTKKNSEKKSKVENLLGGKTGFIKSDEKQYKIEVKGIPECTEACPAGVNVKAYVNLIANRKFEEAIEVIRESNPFPAVCGRVCTRPCEETCILSETGDSISIRALKRYASDYELARRPILVEPYKTKYDEKIAIIGAGPAGLTAAFDLLRLGFSVTVFEASNEPGGMLRYGIPPYRLPDRILKREIDWIKGVGVKIKTGKKIKKPEELLKKGFSAVLIAGGAPQSFPLGIQGEKSKGVIDALQFLRDINNKNYKKISGDVVVIGGGSTAFDAARSAIRIGAKKVTIAYRRGIEEMPAENEEIEAAQLENIEILTLSIPKKVKSKDGKVTGIKFLKAKLGKPDKSGRKKPIPIKNSDFIINTDFVIPAIGAIPNIGPIGGIKVTTPKGIIEVKEHNKTIVDGIFAAGDVEMGPSSVVEAIGRGHRAAEGIYTYLKDITPKRSTEIIETLQICLGSPVSNQIRYKPRKIVKEERISTFKEVEKTLTEFEAVEEAARCFTCGPCYACPVCLPNCKNKQLVADINNTKILVKAPLELSEEITYYGPKQFTLKSEGIRKNIKLFSLTSKVDSDLCIGCGRCEEVCAYRAIKNIILKDKRNVSQVAHDSCASCSACVSECPAGAISQGYMSDDEILLRLKNKKTPYVGVKALMSYWSTPSPFFESFEGVVDLMSARKPSPMFLIRALVNTGRGLLLIKPDKKTGSHYLPWEEPPENVVENTWKLLKYIGISPNRIKYVELKDGAKSSDLLKKFSKELDKKGLKKLNISSTNICQNPFGEAISFLKILGLNPDITPNDDYPSLKTVKPGDNGYFEGCLPMLHLLGKAHKLYDLSKTRFSLFELIKKLKINAGLAKGLTCPSKGLTKFKDLDEIVSKISKKNMSYYKKLKINKLIVGTPEAFVSFSKDKNYKDVVSVINEIISSIKKVKKLHTINKTVYLHKACTMDKDPFYEPTKKLLSLIPGVKIIEFEKECGNQGFEKIDGETKKSAIELMKKVEDKGADTIICTSPYCESHLLMCSREGSWRTVEIEISDVYQLLLSSLEGVS